MESKPRSPWISALLSLLCTGLGQIYNGQLLKGIAFWLLGLGLSVGLLATDLPRHFIGLLGLRVISLIWRLAITVEASLAAVRLKEITLRKYNRWYYYLLLASAATVISLGISVAYRNVSGLRAFSVPGISMSPTILPGDRLETDMNYYRHHSPQRGDVVILTVPQLGGEAFVKRIVAIGGDRVTFNNRVVYVNGQPALIPGANIPPLRSPNLEPRDAVTVPPGSVFVTGDNLLNSDDSRYFGPVNSGDIEGKALYIYYSKQKNHIGMNL